MKKFLTFTDARDQVRKLGLLSKKDWINYSRTIRPNNVPSCPWQTYREEWVSFMDWMGYDVSYHKYSVNQKFFKDWSSDMAYVLGFWFADGYIYTPENIGRSKKKRWILGVGQTEKDILQCILDAMESDHPLHEENKEVGKTSYRFFIESQEIVEDVIALGGKERKSLDMLFPEVPASFLPDFIRGLWDGDGSVFSNGRSILASLTCGSKEFIDKVYQRLYDEGVIMGSTIVRDKRRKSVWYLMLSVNDTRRLRNFMYQQDGICLKRKEDKFKEAGDIVKCPAEIKQGFLPYREAREFALGLGLKTQREWYKYWKTNRRPFSIPSNPQKAYQGDGWESWMHWLKESEV